MRRKLRNLAFSGLMVAAMSVGLPGTAHANIVNDYGTGHWKVRENGQCMMFNPDVNLLEQYRCVNAPSEEFSEISIGPVPDDRDAYNKLLKNYWTGKCMGVAQTALYGGRVYGMPCDANNIREFWHWEYVGTRDGERYYQIHAATGDNLCLDRDRDTDADGQPIQVWTCGDANPLFPLEDDHSNQWWGSL